MSVSPLSPDEKSQFNSLLQAEKDLNDNILTAQREAKLAQERGEQRINEIQDYYVDLAKQEKEQGEQSLTHQKTQTYEQLRSMKQLHSRHQKDAQDQFRNQTNELNKNQNQRLQYIKNNFDRELNSRQESHEKALAHESNSAREQVDHLKTEHNEYMKSLDEHFNQEQQTLLEAHEIELNKIKENQQRVTQKQESKHLQEYSKQLKQHKNQTQQMQDRLNQQIANIQMESSKQLSTYESQQQDGFYKMITIDAQIIETKEEFVITANIPKYEQPHFYATVRGDQIVIGGYRKHEEKRSDQEGHEQSTASYQSYTKTYPLSHPVDAKKLTRQFIDDQVIIRVPKTSGYKMRSLEQAKPEKIQATKPELPENIFISTYTKEPLS